MWALRKAYPRWRHLSEVPCRATHEEAGAMVQAEGLNWDSNKDEQERKDERDITV